VHPHAQSQIRVLLFDRAADLECAFHRIFRAAIENQRHAIAGREFKQLVVASSFAEFVRRLNDLIQLFDGSPLIVGRHFGIRHDVDKKDVGDFELNFLFNLGRHYRLTHKRIPEILSTRLREVESKAGNLLTGS